MAQSQARQGEEVVIEISEHAAFGPLEEDRLTDADLDFIENVVNDGRRRVELTFDRQRRPTLSTKSFVGVVGLPYGPRLRIEPKAAAGNLIPMLLFATESTVDVFDRPTDVEGDGWFVDAFAALYLAELDGVLRRGLRQEYVHVESSERYLRGQLNVQRQQQRWPVASTSFECDYDELTYDTRLNQAVLYATDVLSQLVRSDELSGRLAERVGVLRQQITRRPISRDEVSRIELTRLNGHYSTLLELVQTVIDRSFIEGIGSGERRALSFLIDMNRLYERVVERTVERICRDRAGWAFETQSRTDSLFVGSPSVPMYPDVVLRIDGTVAAVIDAKWKTNHSNSDIYQLLAYQSVHEAPGMLVYPQTGTLETSYEVEDGEPLYLVELPTMSMTTDVDDFARALSRKLLETVETGTVGGERTARSNR